MITFERKLSLDGVAIIVAVVMTSVWFGILSEKVEEHTQAIRQSQEEIKKLSDNLATISVNLATVTVIVGQYDSKHGGRFQ